MVRKLGQEWRKCPYEWGVDDLVIIETSAGRLALCDVVQIAPGDSAPYLEVRPVKAAELKDMPTE